MRGCALLCLAVCVGVAWAENTPTRVDVKLYVQGIVNQQALQAVNEFKVDLMLAIMNTNNDNYITSSEISAFTASLDNNKNNNIERCEYVSYFKQQLNLTAPVATFLYNIDNNITNDINGSIVFAYDEFKQDQTLAEVRQLLIEGVYNAALLAYGHRDIIIASDTSQLPASSLDLARMIDVNKDGVITYDETSAAFDSLDADGNQQITRCEMSASPGSRGADDSPAGDLAFDLEDLNGDGVISKDENNLRNSNGTGFRNITTEEMAKQMAQRMWISRQKSGLPIAAPDYKCEWMNRTLPNPSPSFDALLFVADADVNYDDVITQQELHDVVDTYAEKNFDGKLTRCEFEKRATSRYNVTTDVANAIFDVLDQNRDREVTSDDIDVTVADYDNDGMTSTCELYLFMIYLTGKAENFGSKHEMELAGQLFQQALDHIQRKQFQGSSLTSWFSPLFEK